MVIKQFGLKIYDVSKVNSLDFWKIENTWLKNRVLLAGEMNGAVSLLLRIPGGGIYPEQRNLLTV